MTPEQVLRAYYENANEINAITARRQPTFEEKVRLAKMVGAHLKRNVIPQKREGAWFDRKRGDEGIYAVPNYHMLLGEIPGPIKGISMLDGLKAGKTLTGMAYEIADSGKYTLAQLQKKQNEFAGLASSLHREGKLQEAMDAASEHQMWREAAERLQGQPQHFK